MITITIATPPRQVWDLALSTLTTTNILNEDNECRKILRKYPFEVVSCGDPTGNMTSQNIIYDTGTQPANFNYLTSSTLRCAVGKKWSDNAITKTMTCSADGRWTGISASCLGILSFEWHLLHTSYEKTLLNLSNSNRPKINTFLSN